jgi:hypothetical protein
LREVRRRRLIGLGEEAASCALLLCTVEVSSSFLFLNDAALQQYYVSDFLSFACSFPLLLRLVHAIITSG